MLLKNQIISYVETNHRDSSTPYYDNRSRVMSYLYRFPLLYTKLPYEYFSTQDYSLSEEEKRNITGDNRDIIVAQISNSNLVSMDPDSKVILGKIINDKVKEFPFILYMFNNFDDNLISDRHDDIRNKNMSLYRPVDINAFKIINDICYPYFMFYRKEYDGSNNDLIETTLKDHVYRSNFDHRGKNLSEFDYLDFYLMQD